MSTPANIVDGTGTKRKAHVTEDHALLVTDRLQSGFFIDSTILTRYKLLRTFLKAAGSIEMNVDGSVNSVEFEISAQEDKVLYVQHARVIINGTYFEVDTNDFRRFGLATVGGGSLSNGITFNAYQGGVETSIFASPVKQTGDFFNYLDDFTNLKNSIGAQEDFLSVDFILEKPIVLVPGTTDKLVMAIRDDLTLIDQFRCVIRGHQEVR